MTSTSSTRLARERGEQLGQVPRPVLDGDDGGDRSASSREAPLDLCRRRGRRARAPAHRSTELRRAARRCISAFEVDAPAVEPVDALLRRRRRRRWRAPCGRRARARAARRARASASSSSLLDGRLRHGEQRSRGSPAIHAAMPARRAGSSAVHRMDRRAHRRGRMTSRSSTALPSLPVGAATGVRAAACSTWPSGEGFGSALLGRARASGGTASTVDERTIAAQPGELRGRSNLDFEVTRSARRSCPRSGRILVRGCRARSR